MSRWRRLGARCWHDSIGVAVAPRPGGRDLASTPTASPARPQTVLEQGGQFAGINRKVQLKPLRWSAPEEGSGEAPRCVEALLILKHGGVLTHAGRQQVRRLGALARGAGPGRDWCTSSACGVPRPHLLPRPPSHPPMTRPSPACPHQAETLGNLFRNVMYPPSAGGGLLRLHFTYRHDLKIYSSGAGGGGGVWVSACVSNGV